MFLWYFSRFFFFPWLLLSSEFLLLCKSNIYMNEKEIESRAPFSGLQVSFSRLDN